MGVNLSGWRYDHLIPTVQFTGHNGVGVVVFTIAASQYHSERVRGTAYYSKQTPRHSYALGIE